MKISSGHLRLSASDLSNHLACRHVTTLDLEVARGLRAEPDWPAPDLKVIQELGLRHEAAYLAHLRERGLNVENLGSIDHKNEKKLLEKTLELMERGVDVIAQGALRDGEWFGRPDVLRRVARAGGRWDWSYEVTDTKLARETKATTILQLSLYSELLGKAQGVAPVFLWVVPTGMGFAGEKYRVGEYAAYYRYVKERLLRAARNVQRDPRSASGPPQTASPTTVGGESAAGQYALEFGRAQAEACATYPEPVEHCNVCRWFRECDGRRRADDHLSLVAGIRRQQRDQFEEWDAGTMAKLAELPIPLKERPKHGARVGYEQAREQARVQVEGRTQNKLKHEPLLPVAEGMGLCRLPEPAAGDVFLDLEGDPFVGEQGLQYLFGFAYRDAAREWRYEKKWALNREEEKRGFEWVVDEIMRRRAADPKMHVYHFGGYEPGALKRLMGMYATREDEIDRMLRAGVLVDLHQAFKQSTRASVEEYSLKKIEAFYRFARATPLDLSRAAMRYVEHRLELGRLDEAAEIPEEFRTALEGYNGEDCVSTGKLRDWLEERRAELVARGIEVPRLPEKSGDPREALQEKLERAAALTELLSAGIPVDAQERTEDQSAQWLLAQLLSWHRREDKRAWQDGYRYAEMNDEDLLDERVGLTKMSFVERVDEVGRGRQMPTDRYSFEPQAASNVRVGKEVYFGDEKFGEVVRIDHVKGVVDIKKTKKTADVHPPTVYMWDAPLNSDAQAGSLYRIGAWVAENGIDAAGRYRAGRDLLLRRPPRLTGGEK
jgi:predicted RecB family nuclease